MRRKKMNKGGVFIISGPSGSGKDTVLAELFRNRPDLLFSISSVTRPMRSGEKEGDKYNFISREPVERAVAEGKDIIIEVDVNGAAQIRKKLPEAVSIFIMPPSFQELKRRLRGRGTESEELIEKRLNSALGEIKRASEYDYIIVNDNITAAADDILSVILSSSFKTDRQKNIIDEVLSKC